MEITSLATSVVVFLTPFLPYLISASEEAVKEVGKKFGEATWDKAKVLWDKIKKPGLTSVASVLAEDPTDRDFQLALTKLLVKSLESSPELANEVMELVKQDNHVIQKILVENDSRVKDILQRLSESGEQEITIRGSQAGNLTQEQ